MKRHVDQAIGSRATHLFVFASAAVFLTGCAMAGWRILLREICPEATRQIADFTPLKHAGSAHSA